MRALLLLVTCWVFSLGHAFQGKYVRPTSALRRKSPFMNSDSTSTVVADFAVSTTMNQLGGKIVVSGIGEKGEDEFMLNLLNEQVKLLHAYRCITYSHSMC